MWWHTLIFHFHFCSTCCLGVRHKKNKKMPKKERKRGKKKAGRLTVSITLVLLSFLIFFFVCHLLPVREDSLFSLPIDCELAGLLLETLLPNVSSR